jgi:hypothetical protein
MPRTEQILGSIEQRIRELHGEIDALAAARAEFVGSRSESRKPPTRATRSGGRANVGAAQAKSTVSLRDGEQAVAKPKVIQRAPRKTAPAKPKPGETKRRRVSVAEAIAKAKRDYARYPAVLTRGAAGDGQAQAHATSPEVSMHGSAFVSERVPVPVLALPCHWREQQGGGNFGQETSRAAKAGRRTGLQRQVRAPAPEEKQVVRADRCKRRAGGQRGETRTVDCRQETPF